MLRICISISFILTICSSDVTIVFGQDPAKSATPTKAFQVITLDISSPVVLNYIPFDETFIMEAVVPEGVDSVVCQISVTRRHKKTFNKPPSTATPKRDETSGKYIVKFVVDPIPPNSRVGVAVTQTRHASELTGYTNDVRSSIENLIKEFVRSGASFGSAAVAPLQTSLQKKLNANFPGYRANFAGTILDNMNWTAASQMIVQLFTEYNLANTKLNTFNSLNPPVSPVQDAPTLRDVFRFARTNNNVRVTNPLEQILFSSPSDWSLLGLGLMKIDASINTSPTFPALIVPSPEMTVTQLRALLANIDETRAAVRAVGSYINTSIVGDRAALATISGTVYTAGMDARFSNVVTHLDITEAGLLTARTTLADAIAALTKYESIFLEVISAFKFTLEDQRLLTASSSQAFDTRGSWYIGADAGIVFAPEISEVQPYYGANIYLSPINKTADYSPSSIKRIYGVKHAFGLWLIKHTCFHIGIIPNSIANQDRRIETLWGNNSAMLGAGIRLGSSFRVTSGALVFRGYDADVLNTKKRLASTAYVSASVDINLLKFFGQVGTLLGLSAPANLDK